MNYSRNAHGLISEPSLNDHIGKGREGKGREIGREVGTAAFHLTTRGLWITRRPADRHPMQTAIDGGVL